MTTEAVNDWNQSREHRQSMLTRYAFRTMPFPVLLYINGAGYADNHDNAKLLYSEKKKKKYPTSTDEMYHDTHPLWGTAEITNPPPPTRPPETRAIEGSFLLSFFLSF